MLNEQQDLQGQTGNLDFLGPLLASIGAFPFVPDRLGRYLKDTQKMRGLSGSDVPIYHGTRMSYEGVPSINPEGGPLGFDHQYNTLDPRSAKNFTSRLTSRQAGGKPDPRIIEQIIDASNLGYGRLDAMDGIGDRVDIFKDLMNKGRSGAILDPVPRRKDDSSFPIHVGNDSELEEYLKQNADFLFPKAYIHGYRGMPQVVLWDEQMKRRLGNIFRPKGETGYWDMNEINEILGYK